MFKADNSVFCGSLGTKYVCIRVYLHYVMFYTDGIKMWKLSAQQTGNIIFKQTKSQTTNSQTTGSQTDSIKPPS